jgi:hypothetical protein
MTKNVVFDEDSAARIAAAVKWVEQYSLDETQDPDPDPPPPDTDLVFMVGTFDGSWAKGSYKNVQTNNSGTVNVLNLFADVNDAGDSGVDCAIARAGGWYLIAAEC